MKNYSRYLAVYLLIAGLAVGSGCGDSEPSPAPTRPKARTGKAAKKPDGGAKSTAAAGWGHLKGRFVFDGQAPEPQPLSITQDQNYCGTKMLKDESLIVDEKGGLASVVVYLRATKVNVHDDYKKTEAAEVSIDNRGCRFEPHVVLLRTTQSLKVLNSDPLSHNTNLTAVEGGNETMPAGADPRLKQISARRFPEPVSCNVHPWMRAYLLVLSHPYMAVSGKDGTFEIKNLPAGELQFQAWHERSLEDNRALALKDPDWDQGRFRATIQPDETTDLGEIKVPSAMLVGGK